MKGLCLVFLLLATVYANPVRKSSDESTGDSLSPEDRTWITTVINMGCDQMVKYVKANYPSSTVTTAAPDTDSGFDMFSWISQMAGQISMPVEILTALSNCGYNKLCAVVDCPAAVSSWGIWDIIG